MGVRQTPTQSVYDIPLVCRQVFIVTFGCHLPGGGVPDLVLSAEHQAVGEFTQHEARALPMPQGYKDSIAAWFAAHEEPTGSEPPKKRKHPW